MMLPKHTDVTCEQLATLIAELSAADEQVQVADAIEQHIASCPSCCSAEAGLQRLIAQYHQAEHPPLPDELERRLLDLLCARN